MGHGTFDRAQLLEARHYIHIGIRASEDWQPSYKRNRSTFKALLAQEAELESQVSEYLYQAAERAPGYVDWSAMPGPIKATAGPVANNDAEVWKIEQTLMTQAIIDALTHLTAIGARAGELDTGIDMGASPLNEQILKAARESTAELVKGVTDTTRDKIRESIKQSIANGEDINKSVERLKGIINDPDRAELIARTESVNAYQNGLRTFANQTGATSKEWESLAGACAVCSPMNGKIIAIDKPFILSNGREVQHPSAHPRCRCGLIYSYEPFSEQPSSKTTKSSPPTKSAPLKAPVKVLKKNSEPVSVTPELAKPAPSVKPAEIKTANDAGNHILSTYGDIRYTDDERSKIRLYASDHYRPVNKFLRVGVSELDDAPKYVKAMDAAVKKGSLQSNMTLFRGMQTDRLYKVGQVFSDKGFVSTSLAPEVGDQFVEVSKMATRTNKIYSIKMNSKKGQAGMFPDVAKGTSFASEGEFILPRNTRFKVTKLVEKDGVFNMEVDIL